MISVIMPAYNNEHCILQAVESVVNQIYKQWELIIIDDMSTDNTYDAAKKISDSDHRIKVLRNTSNQGVGKTRNIGVSEASGEWIAFLDSDDMWTPDKLEKQVALVSKNPNIKITFTGSSFISESGEKKEYVLHVPEKITRKELLKQNVISCSSVMAKKDLLVRYPMSDNYSVHEDFAAWLSILCEEEYAYGIDEPLLIYRLSTKSKSGNKFKAARMNWNTYRNMGLGILESTYYMACYTYNGFKKYGNLR